MTRLVSPNELLSAAKEYMLNGGDPTTREDCAKVMNFIAANVHPDVARTVCPFLATLYDMPLTEEEVLGIVEFQLARR